MDMLADLLDRLAGEERLAEAGAQGYADGYAQAREDLLAILATPKTTAARRVALARQWAETD